MGCYDTIIVHMRCPYCGEWGSFDAQTKDLGQAMFTYHTLDEDWFNHMKLNPNMKAKDACNEKTKKKHKGKWCDREFRIRMPVFPQFPGDKESTVWKDQRERHEAQADTGNKQLKYVEVVATCNSINCQFDGDRSWILSQGCPSGSGRLFDGKIKVKDGYLVGPIYDIIKDKHTEKELAKYKTGKYKRKFMALMKKYKHEPIVCRHWN